MDRHLFDHFLQPLVPIGGLLHEFFIVRSQMNEDGATAHVDREVLAAVSRLKPLATRASGLPTLAHSLHNASAHERLAADSMKLLLETPPLLVFFLGFPSHTGMLYNMPDIMSRRISPWR